MPGTRSAPAYPPGRSAPAGRRSAAPSCPGPCRRPAARPGPACACPPASPVRPPGRAAARRGTPRRPRPARAAQGRAARAASCSSSVERAESTSMSNPRSSARPASVAPRAVSAGMPGECSASCASCRARRSALSPSSVHSPPMRTSGWVAAARARNSSSLICRPPSAACRSYSTTPPSDNGPGANDSPASLQLQLLLLAELVGEAHRCARELERGNGRPQVGDLRQRQLDAAVLDPGQRRQDVGGAADPARVDRRDVQGPVAARIRRAAAAPAPADRASGAGSPPARPRPGRARRCAAPAAAPTDRSPRGGCRGRSAAAGRAPRRQAPASRRARTARRRTPR